MFTIDCCEGKNKLTVPKYSNVCDALCHMRINRKMIMIMIMMMIKIMINRKMGICPEVKDGPPQPILPENYK